MDIENSFDGKKGRFFIQENGQTLAEMVYTLAAPITMIIEHTEVGDKLSGKGAGQQLLQKAVEYAREHQYKILPLCPFAKAVMEKKRELYQDVLK